MILELSKKQKVVDVYDALYKKDNMIGEKEFFEFMKRANRDLLGKQRYKVLELAVKYLRGDIK